MRRPGCIFWCVVRRKEAAGKDVWERGGWTTRRCIFFRMSTADATKSEAARLAAHQRLHETKDGARQKLPEQKLDWKFLTPLFWAPTFPIIRLASKRLPPSQRNVLIGVAIGMANLHGFWLINNPDLSDEALGITR